jgi:hypothetical protein
MGVMLRGTRGSVVDGNDAISHLERAVGSNGHDIIFQHATKGQTFAKFGRHKPDASENEME